MKKNYILGSFSTLPKIVNIYLLSDYILYETSIFDTTITVAQQLAAIPILFIVRCDDLKLISKIT